MPERHRLLADDERDRLNRLRRSTADCIAFMADIMTRLVLAEERRMAEHARWLERNKNPHRTRTDADG